LRQNDEFEALVFVPPFYATVLIYGWFKTDFMAALRALADLARLLIFSLCGITGKMVFTL